MLHNFVGSDPKVTQNFRGAGSKRFPVEIGTNLMPFGFLSMG